MTAHTKILTIYWVLLSFLAFGQCPEHTLSSIKHLTDSILSARLGKDVAEKYAFSEEASLIIKIDGKTMIQSSWYKNNIGCGTVYKTNYKLAGDLYSEGIWIGIEADGAIHPLFTLPDILIPLKVKGKPSRLITKKEALKIAIKHGLKDTALFSYQLLVNTDLKPSAYQLYITYHLPSKKEPTDGIERYVIAHTIIVDPWTRKVLSFEKHEAAEVKQQMPEGSGEDIQFGTEVKDSPQN